VYIENTTFIVVTDAAPVHASATRAAGSEPVVEMAAVPTAHSPAAAQTIASGARRALARGSSHTAAIAPTPAAVERRPNWPAPASSRSRASTGSNAISDDVTAIDSATRAARSCSRGEFLK
jgi:hypothetical protein